MVIRPSSHQSLNRKHHTLVLSLVLFLAIIIVCAVIISHQIATQDANRSASENAEITPVEATSTLTEPPLIDLQPTLDAWLATITGTAGVVIYDLNHDQTVASANADRVFATASLYKLFVVYEGYRQITNGTWDGAATLTSGYTINECLDLAIRESNSTCGEALLGNINEYALSQIITNEWGFTNTDIGSSTPNDIAAMLQLYYAHPGLPASTWSKIQDSMLTQPPVDNGLCAGPCNWRQGLPSGFTTATVYNKVGWEHSGRDNIWSTYNDAAIVTFPATDTALAHNYIIVVMTTNGTFEQIARLGTMLEKSVLDNS